MSNTFGVAWKDWKEKRFNTIKLSVLKKGIILNNTFQTSPEVYVSRESHSIDED